MNRFCIYCGAPITGLNPQSPVLTCAACGKSFANPHAPQAPAARSSAAVPVLVIALVAVPAVVAVIGILAAIAIPNFIRFQARGKQAECSSNLRAIAVAQEAFKASHQRYTSDFGELGFHVEPKNRYAYFIGSEPAGVIDADPMFGISLKDREVAQLAHATPGATDNSYVAVCVGQVDHDKALDAWSVSSKERTLDGKVIQPFQLHHEVDDVREE